MEDAQQIPSPEITDIDTQITEIRGKTDLGGEEIGRRLEPLYAKKAALIAQQQDTERQKEQAEFHAERQKHVDGVDVPPEVQAATREVETALRAEWGAEFERNSQAAAKEAMKLFDNDPEKFADFIVRNNLDIDPQAQVEALRFLLKLAGKRKD
jgi:hypothetical protein